jgi:acyl carrier protein
MKGVKPQDTIDDLGMDSLEIVEWQYMIEEAFRIVIPDAAFDDISDAFTIEHVIDILYTVAAK